MRHAVVAYDQRFHAAHEPREILKPVGEPHFDVQRRFKVFVPKQHGRVALSARLVADGHRFRPTDSLVASPADREWRDGDDLIEYLIHPRAFVPLALVAISAGSPGDRQSTRL